MARAKLTVGRGTSYAITFYYRDSDNNPIDLTGATVRFTVKADEWDSNTTDATALIDKTVTSHSNPTAGETIIALTPTETYFDAGSYFYDIKVDVDSDGVTIYKMVEGVFVLDGSPTNRTTG